MVSATKRINNSAPEHMQTVESEESRDIFEGDTGDAVFEFLTLRHMRSTLATSKRMRDLTRRRLRVLLPMARVLKASPFNCPYRDVDLPNIKKMRVRPKVDDSVPDNLMEPLCIAIRSGTLERCERLVLSTNTLIDDSMKAFSSELIATGMRSLRVLELSSCEISDVGLKCFSSAIARAATRRLKTLDLSGNNISDVGMKAFASAILSGGALDRLSSLWLNENDIGNEGMKSFSVAAGSGALKKLGLLSLDGNLIEDEGMKAFATTIDGGALRHLHRISIAFNRIGDKGSTAFAEVISGGALPDLLAFQGPGNAALEEACFMRGISFVGHIIRGANHW